MLDGLDQLIVRDLLFCDVPEQLGQLKEVADECFVVGDRPLACLLLQSGQALARAEGNLRRQVAQGVESDELGELVCPVLGKAGALADGGALVEAGLAAAVEAVHEDLVALGAEDVRGDAGVGGAGTRDFEDDAAAAQEEGGEAGGGTAVDVDWRDSGGGAGEVELWKMNAIDEDVLGLS